jgi:hypothetical protein
MGYNLQPDLCCAVLCCAALGLCCAGALLLPVQVKLLVRSTAQHSILAFSKKAVMNPLQASGYR